MVKHLRNNVLKYLSVPIHAAKTDVLKKKHEIFKVHEVDVVDRMSTNFSNQARSFHHVDIFVAPHGSAAANTFFYERQLLMSKCDQIVWNRAYLGAQCPR